MPRFPLHPARGTGIDPGTWKSIRLAKYGCANRPFFHIVVMEEHKEQREPPIEQLGTFDPMANKYNEKLVTFNFNRLQYWMSQPKVEVSKPIAQLLGLAGYFPIHPLTYWTAWTNRRKAEEEAKAQELQDKQETEKAEASN
ncbi:probable 28S ribosomal protein S16, mitochondrial [Chelonus insularis]|uniref:probable 28S ribosomal protein S16, mitochondrial n=1 Tax=Chelonus insularis TaxID=460826 RepID=UPI00158CE6A6|nr:probable 28S ribosomal protein S16, mitochondrial [Chelonus insularis]